MANVLSAVFLITLLFTPAVHSATLQGDVKDDAGQPVADAVITAAPIPGGAPAVASSPRTLVMDQVNREFVPLVLAIHAGDLVSFPNSDKIQHHVYSFSPNNRFEIKLYGGAPSQPIAMANPGIIVLGCNIHDWMVGYIYVADTPYFAKTDSNGHWVIEAPNGEYTIALWHPRLDAKADSLTNTVKLDGKTDALSHTISLKRLYRTGKPPASSQESVY